MLEQHGRCKEKHQQHWSELPAIAHPKPVFS
jgi:hypothetical protein